MQSGKSAARVSRMALPLSMVSTVANSSKLASMISAILSNKLLRVATELLDQAGKAAWAASNANSTSSLVERAAWVNTCPSIGELLSK